MYRVNVRRIHQVKKGDFIVADHVQLPFKSKTFDLAINVDVLEHMKKKSDVVMEVARVLRKEGRFIGSTTNMLNPLMLLDSVTPLSRVLVKYIGSFNYDRHFRLTPGTLTRMLRSAGFSVSIFMCGFPPFQPWLYENKRRIPLPWFASIWIMFDKLTKHAKILKETMVFEAQH